VLNIATTYAAPIAVLLSWCVRLRKGRRTRHDHVAGCGMGEVSHPGERYRTRSVSTEGAWSRLMPSKQFEEHAKESHPMKRFGRHEELTSLAAFLLSDMAEYINGECVVIDGGTGCAAPVNLMTFC